MPGAHRGARCAQLDANFDHINGLDDAGGQHSTEPAIKEWLDAFPDCVSAWNRNLSHHDLDCIPAYIGTTLQELPLQRGRRQGSSWLGHVCLNVTLTSS